ncbi:MAG: M28 family peptidase [Candidatus Eisenbacteria bacterium]|nr:M28 family peptidase [Candidatus Eisenbacteria bacterium]
MTRARETRRRCARRRRGGRLVAVALAAAWAATLTGCGRPQFDGERAFRFLERQCAMGPRAPGSAGHAEAERWLIETLEGLADEVAVQRFTAVSRGREVGFANVIASFRPAARERVLFATHWDTRPVADLDPDPARRGTPIPGANDGASGTAVLLELATLMSERPPKVGVDLVFFDGEDGGGAGGLAGWCLGSTHYAARLGDYCPRLAVVVDMVGDADLSIPVEPNSLAGAPEAVATVWAAARRAGSLAFEDRRGRAMFDDHIPLLRAGLPAVLVIDAEYEFWHTLADTPDKCSPRSLTEVGRVLVRLTH